MLIGIYWIIGYSRAAREELINRPSLLISLGNLLLTSGTLLIRFFTSKCACLDLNEGPPTYKIGALTTELQAHF